MFSVVNERNAGLCTKHIILEKDDKIQREVLLPWNAFISFILTTWKKHSKSPLP